MAFAFESTGSKTKFLVFSSVALGLIALTIAMFAFGNAASSQKPEVLVVTYGALVLGVLSAFGAFFEFRGYRNPSRLTVKSERILLLANDQVVGQIPFANVAGIKSWYMKQGGWGSNLGIVGVAGRLANALTEKDVVGGFFIQLKDPSDEETFWNTSAFDAGQRHVEIVDMWDYPIVEVRDYFREHEVRYLERHGFPTQDNVADEENPFKFG